MTTFAARRAAEKPEEIALKDLERTFTWGQVDQILNRATNALLGMDLGPDRRVTVFANNAAETVLAHLAGLLAGVSTVPANFHLTAPELAYILENSGTRVIFAGPETVSVALEAARLAKVPQVIAWRSPELAGVVSWESWLAAASAAEPPTDHPPRPNLMYTSGTTGRPKGTELPPTMFAGGATIAEHLKKLSQSPFALFGTHLIVGPLYHTGPLTGVRVLGGGKPVVILPRFDPEGVLRAVEACKAESSVMVPTHFIRLLALPETVRAKYNTKSLKFVFHTGSACPVDVKRAMIGWWGPVLFEAYGATETGTTCMITSAEWLKHPGSVGKALHPFKALVVDENGRELPPRTEGRLYFRDATGRGIVYHNDPQKSAEAHLEPGVFTLGEIGYVDEEGYVYITDRFSDMVVSGGVNIYPAESEQVLIRHPGVEDVACIGVPHPEMGEELKALVIPADRANPPSEKEILEFCRANLSHFKCPRTVEFVEDLGRNPLGKINKKKLRAPYWEAAKKAG